MFFPQPKDQNWEVGFRNVPKLKVTNSSLEIDEISAIFFGTKLFNLSKKTAACEDLTL